MLAWGTILLYMEVFTIRVSVVLVLRSAREPRDCAFHLVVCVVLELCHDKRNTDCTEIGLMAVQDVRP